MAVFPYPRSGTHRRRLKSHPDARALTPRRALRLAAQDTLAEMSKPVPANAIPGKNFLGWGPNVTGLALASLFFGVYYGSSFLARKWILEEVEEPQRPKYFREVTVTDGKSD